jgi:DHA1 family inner membrane transport protein
MHIPHTEESTHGAQRAWPISIAAVIFAMMAIQMSSLGFSPLLPAIRKDFGASYSQIGLFTGMYGLIAILVSVPAGFLIARIGEKRALLAGLLVTAIGLVSLSHAPGFSLGLASRALWLIGYRVAFIGVFTAMAITPPETYRSRVMGILGSMAALASVIGAPFGARIEESLGWRGGINGFAGIAILGACVFAVVYRTSSRKSGIEGKLPSSSAVTRASGSALRNPIIWGMILLGLINMGGFSATFFVPYAVESVFGLGASQAAGIISASYIASMILNLVFGYLCDRFKRWNMMIGLALILIPSCFAAMSPNLMVFRIAIALVISLGHCATNQIYAIAGSVLDKKEAGKGMGIVGLGSGVFGYVGPQMLGYLRDATGGFSAGWLFVAIAASISLIDILVLRAYQLRRTAIQPVA